MEIVAGGHGQVWSPNPGSVVVLTYDSSAKQSGFYKMNVITGQNTRLQQDGRCYNFMNADDHVYAVSGGSRFAYFAEDASHDRDLWMSNADFQSVRRLTHLNPQLDKYKMGEARLVEWHSLDGHILKGALLLPPTYRKGVRYPLVVWVYSGDRGSEFVNRFGLADAGPFNLQLLATRGYAVLFPDIPEDPIAPMANIAKCVLPGINQLVEAGIADPDRIGVMGQSYGGYSVLSLLAQTNRFNAAVEIDGAGNLIGVYGEMDKSGAAFGVSELEQGQGRMGGTPWQHRERYIENSPYFYLDRVETPLLIVQGAEDTTTAPFLADELFVALRRLGKEVEYAKYEGEGHSAVYWRYSNQADYCRRMLSWFNRHMGADQK
jgi:dipeptidyl aminopeptidase/acylaminoacyl peptidase